MRNFSLKTRVSSRRNSKLRTIVTITCVTALFVSVLVLLGPILGNIFSYATYPYYATRHWFAESTAVLPSYLRSRNELLKEIDEQKNTIALAAGNAAVIAKLNAENAELRSLLGVESEKRIAASVIARPPFLPYDTLLIDSGEVAGIKEGSLVYYHNHYALGYVSKTFPRSALITPFSSPGATFIVFIVGPNIFAHAEGEGGGVIRVRVPQGITLAVGNTVLAPTLASGVIGQIASIQSEATEPEQYGFVVLPDSLQSIRLVGVSENPIESVNYETALEHVKSHLTPPLTFDMPTTTTEFPVLVTPSSTTTTKPIPSRN